MTYCLAIRVDAGIVFAADTRTNAGVDYVTTYGKVHVFEPAPDRAFVLLAAGSLATTHELIDQIQRDLDNAPNGESLASVWYPFEAAEYVGRVSRQIQDKHAPALLQSGVSGEVSLILGGQIRGRPPEVMLIYPQGNYIAATEETPYLQIGETKYGKPVLDRLVHRSLSLPDAARLALVSLDATVRSNITVGLPFDFATYGTDSFVVGPCARIEETTPYYVSLRETWQRGFEEMFGRLEPFPLAERSVAPASPGDAPAPIAPGPVTDPLPS
jgi:putative proteasome-type protease